MEYSIRQRWPAVVMHLLPVWPIWQDKLWLTLAMLLCTALPYIKTKKLSAMRALLLERAPKPLAAASKQELQSLDAAIRRWQRATWLPGQLS